MSLYCTATGTTNILSASITQGHDNASASAMVECVSHTLTIGDAISIDMGTDSSHQVVFTGYVKGIEHGVAPNTWVINANDAMVRAIDYFIASADPSAPLSFSNISAEELVRQLMALCGLTSFTYDTTYFTFGVQQAFDVNLVSPADYSRTISDLLTWHTWADVGGTIHFENRKPYVMTGDTLQPGDTTDERVIATSYTLTDVAGELTYGESEKRLRNRVVVYGNSDIFAEAKTASPYLPAGFYKATVLAAPGIIDTLEVAQNTADYNLNLLNRLSYYVIGTVEGNPSLTARQIIKVNSSLLGITNTNYYVYSCSHNFSKAGFTTTLELRR